MEDNNVDKLHDLIKTGTETNIKLAVQLAVHNEISKEELLAPWQVFIDVLELELEYDNLEEMLNELVGSASFTLYLPLNMPVPPEIANLLLIEDLDLSNNALKKLPDEICLLSNLRILDIRGNNINRLPKDIHLLKQLSILYMEETPILHDEQERLLSIFPDLYIKRY